jgi:very-short-patch-repair endonuclease
MKVEEMRHFVYQCAREMRKNPTPAERIFWSFVRTRKFAGLKFNRQFVIEYEVVLGRPSYFIADFHCHQQKWIIEIDGNIHKNQKKWDQIRNEILEDMGYRVIRFSNWEVIENMNMVKAQLTAL